MLWIQNEITEYITSIKLTISKLKYQYFRTIRIIYKMTGYLKIIQEALFHFRHRVSKFLLSFTVRNVLCMSNVLCCRGKDVDEVGLSAMTSTKFLTAIHSDHNHHNHTSIISGIQNKTSPFHISHLKSQL